jgi:hypothetical protein
VFDARLELLVAYGSAVVGDAIPGFSDLDLVAVVRGGLRLDDAERCAALLDGDLDDVAYAQVNWVSAETPEPTLVPGAFRPILGEDVPTELLHTPYTLRRSGATWLAELPDLLARDTGDWAAAVGRRDRALRLLVAHVKPSVKAWLTTLGEEPVATYAAPWGRLANAARRHDMGIADGVQSLVDGLRVEPRDELALGSASLHLLTRIAEHV